MGFGSAFFDSDGEAYSFGSFGSNWDYKFDSPWIPTHILEWVKSRQGTAQRKVSYCEKSIGSDLYIKVKRVNFEGKEIEVCFWIDAEASIQKLDEKMTECDKEDELLAGMNKLAFEGKFIQIRVNCYMKKFEIYGKIPVGFSGRRISAATIATAKELDIILGGISSPEDLEKKIEDCKKLLWAIYKDDPESLLHRQTMQKIKGNELYFFKSFLFPREKVPTKKKAPIKK